MANDLSKIIHGAANRSELWSCLLRAHDVRSFAEIGVWKGAFASAVLAECDFISPYYLVDPWRPLADWNKPLNLDADQFEKAYQAAMEAISFAKERTIVLRGTTREMANHIPDGCLDAVYVDGDHTLRGISIDLIRMIAKLRPGGLLAGDDFFPDPWHHGLQYEPTMVAPFALSFAEALELPIFALPFNQFLIYNKPSSFAFVNLSGVSHPRRVGCPSNLTLAEDTGGSAFRYCRG